MSNRVRIGMIVIFLLAGILLPSITVAVNSWPGTSISQFPVGSGSWNPRVPCSSPWVVRITDITDNMTGSSSQTSSIFNPGITSPVGTAKRWLTPGTTPTGWVSPGPACTIVNSHGTIALFVEVDGVKRGGITNEDCTGSYDAVNGGTSNGGSFCDSTFNIYDPAIISNYGSSCTSATDPTCNGRIHSEIDHDWKAAHYCGPSTTCDDGAVGSQTTTSSLIDFQGFISWDPGNLNQQWHNFNGWEIHPVTAWRQHQTNPGLSTSFTFSPSSPTLGQNVTFTASATGGTPPYTFNWNFGDSSTGTGVTVSRSYAASGSFAVRLSTTDAKANTATSSSTITISPVLTVTATIPPTGTVGSPVSVSANASGGSPPYIFSWSFGDGTANVPGPTASHTYTVSGSYVVRVSATDGASQTASASSTITINPAALTTDFTSSPTIVQTGTSVSFTATVSGGTGPYTYSWSFGDGASASGNPVSHAYATSGTFTIQLLVTDSVGANASASHAITVAQPAKPDYAITSNPSTLQIVPGESGSSVITLTSIGGFTGTINLSSTITPSGPSISLSPMFVTLGAGGSATANLVVTTESSTPIGNYTVTITGNSTAISHSATVLVMVQLAPGFSLNASASTINIPRTTSGTITLSLASMNGFSGTVNLSVTVSPSGPRASLSSPTITLTPGGSANALLTIRAVKKTPVGSYTFTITATNGPTTHTQTITVNVT